MTLQTIFLNLSFTAAADGVEATNDAIKSVSIQTLVIVLVSSSAFTTWLSWFLSRRNQSAQIIKVEAEANKTEAEADNIVAQTFSEVIQSLKDELLRLKSDLTQSEKLCSAKVDRLKEEHQAKLDNVNRRISILEEREEQATSHIQNLETKLRELGVALPPTPWKPQNFRRRYGGSNQPRGSGDPSG